MHDPSNCNHANCAGQYCDGCCNFDGVEYPGSPTPVRWEDEVDDKTLEDCRKRFHAAYPGYDSAGHRSPFRRDVVRVACAILLFLIAVGAVFAVTYSIVFPLLKESR